MKIPDFIKTNTLIDPVSEEMQRLIEKYTEEIGDDLITEPSSYTDEEWVDMLKECIEKKITIWQLWGEKYDTEATY